MTTAGRYQELPLPKEWLFSLRQLQATAPSIAYSMLPSPVGLAHDIFEVLNSRESFILFSRYGKGMTLGQVGQGLSLTRERVRQIENKIFGKIEVEARASYTELTEFFKDIYPSSFVVKRMPPDSRQVCSNATLDELWQCVLAVYSKLCKTPYVTGQLSEDIWIVYDSSKVQPAALKVFAKDQVRFFRIDEAAYHIGATKEELAHSIEFFDGIYLTVSGKLGSSCWTMLQFMEAIAWELQEENCTEWHFSEMARALEFVYPDKFAGIISRNIVAALTREEATMFQHAGRKGMWQLTKLGDGYRGNKAAVINVFKRSPSLLHYTDVIRQLQRPIHAETIHALLLRDSAFKSYGNGIYGLTDELSSSNIRSKTSHDDLMGASTCELADFLVNILGETGKLLGSQSEKSDLESSKPRNDITPIEKISATRSEDLAKRIIQLIRDNPSCLTGREIAKILGEEKKSVNRCLHLYLKRIGWIDCDRNRRWFISEHSLLVPERNHKAST